MPANGRAGRPPTDGHPRGAGRRRRSAGHLGRGLARVPRQARNGWHHDHRGGRRRRRDEDGGARKARGPRRGERRAGQVAIQARGGNRGGGRLGARGREPRGRRLVAPLTARDAARGSSRLALGPRAAGLRRAGAHESSNGRRAAPRRARVRGAGARGGRPRRGRALPHRGPLPATAAPAHRPEGPGRRLGPPRDRPARAHGRGQGVVRYAPEVLGQLAGGRVSGAKRRKRRPRRGAEPARGDRGRAAAVAGALRGAGGRRRG
mmetsp:Transcript_3839/g.11569  ORF Transcript_3839/g.11569 Transcript_3839/m.11569 type:complete len:263 (+) Transcript_3839:48-836(+)